MKLTVCMIIVKQYHLRNSKHRWGPHGIIVTDKSALKRWATHRNQQLQRALYSKS